MANLLTRVPKRARLSLSKDLAWPPWYAPSTSNYLPPRSERSPERVTYRNGWHLGYPRRHVAHSQVREGPRRAHWTAVVEQLREPFAQVAELLADAAPDILAFTAFPVAHWQKLWSNNPQERCRMNRPTWRGDPSPH